MLPELSPFLKKGTRVQLSWCHSCSFYQEILQLENVSGLTCFSAFKASNVLGMYDNLIINHNWKAVQVEKKGLTAIKKDLDLLCLTLHIYRQLELPVHIKGKHIRKHKPDVSFCKADCVLYKTSVSSNRPLWKGPSFSIPLLSIKKCHWWYLRKKVTNSLMW